MLAAQGIGLGGRRPSTARPSSINAPNAFAKHGVSDTDSEAGSEHHSDSDSDGPIAAIPASPSLASAMRRRSLHSTGSGSAAVSEDGGFRLERRPFSLEDNDSDTTGAMPAVLPSRRASASGTITTGSIRPGAELRPPPTETGREDPLNSTGPLTRPSTSLGRISSHRKSDRGNGAITSMDPNVGRPHTSVGASRGKTKGGRSRRNSQDLLFGGLGDYLGQLEAEADEEDEEKERQK